jgi:hypothetical protein
MLGENAFNAHVEADLAYGKRTAQACAVALQDDALEYLHAQFVAFDNLVVHGDSVADAEFG